MRLELELFNFIQCKAHLFCIESIRRRSSENNPGNLFFLMALEECIIEHGLDAKKEDIEEKIKESLLLFVEEELEERAKMAEILAEYPEVEELSEKFFAEKFGI